MKNNTSIIELYRVREGPLASDHSYGNNGLFLIRCPLTCKTLKVIASDGMGWEHVSVSLSKRDPLWKEMCFIKDIFWEKDETVIQYHPPKSEYVNFHKHCLHMWKSIDMKIPTPPTFMVGPT